MTGKRQAPSSPSAAGRGVVTPQVFAQRMLGCVRLENDSSQRPLRMVFETRAAERLIVARDAASELRGKLAMLDELVVWATERAAEEKSDV